MSEGRLVGTSRGKLVGTSRDRLIPRIIVAGTASGVGKTTTMVALIGALRARGLKVACFKCGPDYLDPTYYRLANEAEPHHLDPWMMGRDGVKATFMEGARDADIALIEGMMGLYDGISPNKETGSTAQLAKWLDAPVLLVLDASGMARSVAATVLGYVRFDPEINFGGVWCNRIGSQGHLDLLRRARPCKPVLGGLPRKDDVSFTERHLGLVAAQRDFLPKPVLQSWAKAAEMFGQLDRLIQIAGEAPPIPYEATKPKAAVTNQPVRLGIARDAAFSFYYGENLRLLEASGAELVPFSPIHDRELPAVDGLYFGGGYPECYASELAENAAMRQAVHAFADQDGPIYAECGGFMYLTDAIQTLDGREHAMVGWFPGKALMRERLQAIGYAEAICQTATHLGSKGTRLRGHQFRYSHFEPGSEPGTPFLRLMSHTQEDRGGEGWVRGSVCASYFHAHWASNPMIPRTIVRNLAKRRAQP